MTDAVVFLGDSRWTRDAGVWECGPIAPSADLVQALDALAAAGRETNELRDEIERLRAEVDRLTGEREELRALISSCDSGQTALTCHLKLRLIRDAMRAVCTQRRDCMAIDHDYPCPMGGRP